MKTTPRKRHSPESASLSSGYSRRRHCTCCNHRYRWGRSNYRLRSWLSRLADVCTRAFDSARRGRNPRLGRTCQSLVHRACRHHCQRGRSCVVISQTTPARPDAVVDLTCGRRSCSGRSRWTLGAVQVEPVLRDGAFSAVADCLVGSVGASSQSTSAGRRTAGNRAS